MKRQTNDGIRNIIIMACMVRVFVLVLIWTFSAEIPAYGFIDNSPLYDDYRYEQGAYLYLQRADGIVDTETFTAVYDELGDWTGHNLANPFVSTPFWYWTCCVLVYITKTRWSVRFLNIILSVMSVKLVWNITKHEYGARAAKSAARMMAYLPYFVIFSCFSYKDNFVMYATLLTLWKAIEIKKCIDNKSGKLWKNVAIEVFVSLLMMMTRSGLFVIWDGFLLMYIYHDQIKTKMRGDIVIIVGAIMIVGIVGLCKTFDVLLYKFSAYNSSSAIEGLGLGSLVKITSITEIWKLPLTYMFSILQPLKPLAHVDSWYALVLNINIIMAPIAVGSIMHIVFDRKSDKMFFVITGVYYLITATSSILIFRQLFSLLPIPVMYCAAAKEKYSVIILMGSFLMIVAFIVLFFVI